MCVRRNAQHRELKLPEGVCVLHIYRWGLNLTQQIYVDANNPIRNLLDRQRSEEHLQSSNEGITTKTKQNKNDKKKGVTQTKHIIMPEKGKIRAIDTESLVYHQPRTKPSDTPPDRNC